MILYPAIDLKDGQAVRLVHGDMDRSTVFITAYDSFGNSTRWAEFLLYEGELMEVALKSR